MQDNYVFVAIALQVTLVIQLFGLSAMSATPASKTLGSALEILVCVSALLVALTTLTLAFERYSAWNDSAFVFTQNMEGGGPYRAVIGLIVLLWPTSVILLGGLMLVISLRAIGRPSSVLSPYLWFAGTQNSSSASTESVDAANKNQESPLDEAVEARFEKASASDIRTRWAEASTKTKDYSVIVALVSLAALLLIFFPSAVGKLLAWGLCLAFTGMMFGFTFNYLPQKIWLKLPNTKWIWWLLVPPFGLFFAAVFFYLLFLYPTVLAEFIWGGSHENNYAALFVAQFLTLGGYGLQVQIVRRLTESTADGE